MLVYSLAYISNNTEVLNTGNIQFKFNGYKTFVTPGCRPEDLRDDKELAYKIYSWTYSEGHCSDKLGLVRNIFTLNTLNEGLNLSLSTWHTIQSNYEIYLKDNVGQYLELKGKLLELISDFSKRTLDATDGFISSFQSSAAAFITFIVSVVAINGLKDAGTETIFSTEYFMISVFISIASALWLVFSRRDTKDRIDYLTSQTKSSILENYKNILSPEELNASIDPAVQSVKTHTKKRIKKYTTLWLLSLAAFLIVFSVGLSITKNEERKSQTPYRIKRKSVLSHSLKRKSLAKV
ncbi:hypothetical protein M5C90_06095 [Pseudomonas chlororaphis subsp. piscium]|nr:hypothetical protein M5C90_06095 [Pseudomonas chlororaphis subsp. piscium]